MTLVVFPLVPGLISHGATVDAAARTVGFADPRMLRRLRSRANPVNMQA